MLFLSISLAQLTKHVDSDKTCKHSLQKFTRENLDYLPNYNKCVGVLLRHRLNIFHNKMVRLWLVFDFIDIVHVRVSQWNLELREIYSFDLRFAFEFAIDFGFISLKV